MTILDRYRIVSFLHDKKPKSLDSLFADHAHQLGPMPPSDPFAPTQAPLSPWVAEHRDQILERHDLHGMTLLLVDVQQEKIERSPILPDAGMAE
ncbi:hypothetical protein [Aggregatilinea lenta]|uniref:hypothetical protein n=1 Tax=Aggregatilinea lenta TaxID=913108 RepID=UPI000E5C04FF|nr:hypothetical protein [Aggregatilinea lenta]